MRLDDVPREILAAGLALTFAYVLVIAIRTRLRRVRLRRRFERAATGEREAVRLLEAEGFRIEGFQVQGSYEIFVDREPVSVRLYADYVVSRRGRRFVAEVKTGKLAPRIETASTRRQLLEYEHAFGVEGVLLVDAEARTVRRVAFPRARTQSRWPAWAIVAAAVAVVAGWRFLT